MVDDIPAERITAIQNALLTWFSVFGRTFPWRQTREPLQLLLAEKLLQQTSVREDTIRTYINLVSAYPSVEALAEADIDQLYQAISPLGLHYRARELTELAQEILDKFNGVIPNELYPLLSIKGVGDYTARALLCFAFGQDVPIVDTNVARILYRVFGLLGKMPANPARKQELIQLAGMLVPRGKARQFNWALLDLGALVCKTSKPQCEKCPLQNLCAYSQERITVNDSA